MPRVGLFVPCYIDQFYPDVGFATLELLEKYGCQVEFPVQQTCCGQPMANTGCTEDAKPLAEQFLRIFANYDHIVSPSGSCVAMIRAHYADLVGNNPQYATVRDRTFELCEYLVDVLKVQTVEGTFPYRVGVHQSCHGLRELRLGSCSELMVPAFSKAGQLLKGLQGIQLVNLKRSDECCSFGGTFAVAEEAISCMMGQDRIADHEQAGAQVITAGDMSCLMHLEGLIRRQKKNLQVMHVAQILAGRQPSNLVPTASAT